MLSGIGSGYRLPGHFALFSFAWLCNCALKFPVNSLQNPKFNKSQKQTISELIDFSSTVMPCLVLPQIVLVETGLYTKVCSNSRFFTFAVIKLVT